MSGAGARCELCGETFATEQEKEEHKKLEHKEHREPSGVGQTRIISRAYFSFTWALFVRFSAPSILKKVLPRR